MTILITGASGFSGKCLTQTLVGEKTLLVRTPDYLEIANCKTVTCDLLEIETVKNVVKELMPTEIYHLAGSFTNDYEVDFRLNVTATKNLLDSVKQYVPTARILLVGSAAEYGLITNDQCPVKEDSPLQPCNVYGLTKIYQKYLMDFYAGSFSLDIVMARPFNLYGRDISPRLFIGKVYREIAKFKNGITTEISLGNLNSERDYISIEKAISHYIKIMASGLKGEIYNVGLGVPTRTGEILKVILEEEGLDMSAIRANTRNTQLNDSDRIYADISKLKGLYND